MSALVPPPQWKGRHVPTLDVLVYVADALKKGFMLEMFLGSVDVRAMAAFVEGVSQSLYCAGFVDDEYQGFLEWLRDRKQEWPATGWWTAYLAEFNGDHRAAIMKFLDRVREFRELGELQGEALRAWP